MRPLDRLLQRWRISRAVPWVRPGDRLLDVGCFDRSLIDRVAARVGSAVGLDPEAVPFDEGRLRMCRGVFPEDAAFGEGDFDCITALAVLEHVPRPEAFAEACRRLLAPGGRVVLTVPHPWVDGILDLLMRLGLADGMAAEEHHGFDVARTRPVFEAAGLRLLHTGTFQLGLNRVFVFEREAGAQSSGPLPR